MARGKLGVLLMALLLAVSCPRVDGSLRHWKISCRWGGDLFWGCSFQRIPTTWTGSDDFPLSILGDFFCFLLYFPGCIFSWGENSNTQNYNFGSISPQSYWTQSSDPKALVKRVYAMEILEVEPRLELERLYVSDPETNSYQPVRPWKSMVGILR